MSESKKAAEHILEFNYFDLPGEKFEGQPMATDEIKEGRKRNISHRVFALAAEFSWEALSDEQYGRLKSAGRELGRSMRELNEIKGHIMLNDGFSAELAIDGLSVFNTAHVNLKLGTTYSNRAATDLTLGALEQMYVDFMLLTDGTGKRIRMRPEMLICPPETWATAAKLLETMTEPFTANNTKNVMAGKVQYLVDPYVNDTDSWFVRTSLSETNSHFFFRDRPMQDSWDDKKSRISAFAIIERIGWGTSDPRGWYGSPGA